MTNILRARGGHAPLLAAACLFALLECVAFAVNFRRPTGPQILTTLPLLGGFAVLVYAQWRAWRATRDPAGRRFLRLVAIALTAYLVGLIVDIPAAAGGPTAPANLFRIGVFILFVAVIMVGLLKSMMSASTGVDPRALRLFAAGLLVEITGIGVAPLVDTRPELSVELLARAIGTVAWVAAAIQQARAAGAPAPGAQPAAHRPLSILFYVAVAGVDGLLLATLADQGQARLAVGAVAVAMTALLVARLVGAFRHNASLLAELGHQERRFRSLVEHAADAMAICDRNGSITYVSPGAHRLTGRPAKEWVGTTGPAVHPDDLSTAERAFAAIIAEPGGTATYQIRVAHLDGGWRWIEITLTNLLDDPAVAGVVSNASDISEAQTYHRQLSHQASHDSLTDLANRSLFGDQLKLALSQGSQRRVSLALIDLDDFKAINDNLGHHAGDALLIAVAERLRRSVRPQDLVARLGGDEFAVLLDGAAPAHVEAIADRILGSLTEPIDIDGHTLCVQASVGIAEAGQDTDEDLLMRHADLALYAAKDAGKGRYVRHAETMRPKLSLRAESAAELHRALSDDEFELHYQPIVTLPEGRIAGAEALLRWRHRERGLIPPLDFIPTAERTGLIVPIGRWVLGQACRDAAAWLAAHPTNAPATISVNVSPRQLVEASFVEDVIAALAGAGLPAHRLIIEVVESAVVQDAEARLQELRAMGVRIALDDFGTGHSTLSLLDSCPVDELKLDRSFVRNAGQHKVATAVSMIGEAVGADIVAEGIETAAQAEYLYALGYRLAQGFHFARPAPAAVMAESLRAANLDNAPIPG